MVLGGRQKWGRPVILSRFFVLVMLLGCVLPRVGERMTFSVAIISHSDLSACSHRHEIGMCTTGAEENACIIKTSAIRVASLHIMRLPIDNCSKRQAYLWTKWGIRQTKVSNYQIIFYQIRCWRQTLMWCLESLLIPILKFNSDITYFINFLPVSTL